MKTNYWLSFMVAGALSLAIAAWAKDGESKVDPSKLPPPAAKSDVTYDKDIKPIFQRACVECHGPQKAKGGVRYDSREAAIKGGKHGNGIAVGESAKSTLIYDLLPSGNQGPWMPPQKKSKLPPLTKEEIGLVRAWIDQGAR